MIAVAAPYLPQPGRCSSVAEQLFRKQQVAGSIPITGSILLKLNQVDFGKSQKSITEKCPPNAHQLLTSHQLQAQNGPGLSPGPLLFDNYEEVGKMAMHHRAPVTEDGKVANSGAQGVLDGFAGLMTDGQDGHRILER